MLKTVTVKIEVGSPTDICAFIQQHGDYRITLEALTYYSKPDGPGIAILGYVDDTVVGVSACKIDKGKMTCAISVTHRDYRGNGIAPRLLREKIAKAGVPYRTIVADDNLASIRMCEKAGLKKVGTEKRYRSGGAYTAFVFSSE